MHFRALSATVVGLAVAACAGPYEQLALVQSQHTYAACAHDPCRPLRSAALSSKVMRAEINVPASPAGERLTTSASGSVPELAVEQVCQGIAEQGGVTFHDPEMGRAKKACLDDEQRVRNELVKGWRGFETSDRVHCVRESKMGGQSSYSELITCLEMAREARKLHEQNAAAPPAQAVSQR